MSQKDALFRLIQGMSKSEKKYFKENVYGNNLIYIKLFDALNDLEYYDESAFIKKNQQKDFIKNYAYNKNYLFEQLLKSLSTYKAKKDIHDISYEKFQHLKVLSDKGLYDLVEKNIKKLKQYCYELEVYERLEEVLNFEFQYLEKRYLSKDKTIEELQKLMQMKHNGVELNKMYTKIIDIATAYDYSLHDSLQYLLDDILNHPLVKSENHIFSRTGKYARFNILSLSAYITKDFSNAFIYKYEAYKLYEKDKIFYEINPKSYLNLIGNMIAIAYNIPDKEKFKLSYNILIENHPLIQGQELTKFEQYCSFSIMKCNLLEDYTDFDEVVNYYFESKNRFQDKLSKTHEIDTLFNISVGYFLAKKYDKAYEITNQLINHPLITERFLVERYTKLLELFILLVQKEFNVLEHRIVAFDRYLKKHNSSEIIYEICLKYFRKLYKLNPNENKSNIIKEWQNNLDKVSDEEYVLVANDMFDIKNILNKINI